MSGKCTFAFLVVIKDWNSLDCNSQNVLSLSAFSSDYLKAAFLRLNRIVFKFCSLFPYFCTTNCFCISANKLSVRFYFYF